MQLRRDYIESSSLDRTEEKKNTKKTTKKQKKATNRMQIIIEQDMPQLRQGTEDTRREELEGTQMMYEGSMA